MENNNNNVFLGKIERPAVMLIMGNMAIFQPVIKKIINYLNFYFLKK